MKTFRIMLETKIGADCLCRENLTFLRRLSAVAMLLLCSLLTFAQSKSLSGSAQCGLANINYTLYGDYEVEKTYDNSSGNKDYVVKVKPGAEIRAEFSCNSEYASIGVWDRDCPTNQGIIKNEQISSGHCSYTFTMKENSFYVINFVAPVINEAAGHYDTAKVRIQCYTSYGESEASTIEIDGSDVTTKSKEDMESGNVESDDVSGWEIPVGVATAVMLGGGAASVFNKKEDDDVDGDDEDDDEGDEPEEENPHLTWRMMKEFDDNLFVGEAPQTIAAKIVQILYEAGEAVQDIPQNELTNCISISASDNLVVSNIRMLRGGFKAADVKVKPGQTPEQLKNGGYVYFTLAANGGRSTMSMHFNIVIPTLEAECLDVILGDDRIYKTEVTLNSIRDPKELRIVGNANYEMAEPPVRMEGESGNNGGFIVKILNKTKKPETNVVESRSYQYDSVTLTIEAEFDDNFVVKGELRVREHPEGMFFMVKKTTNGYANVDTDNAKDRIIFGISTVVRIPTDVTVYFSKYDVDNETVSVSYVKQLKAAGGIKGQGEYEEGLARDFSFEIKYVSGTYDFTPLTTLAMESKDKPYLAELPLKGVVEYDDYSEEPVEGNLKMALYGLVPYMRTDWDNECDRLLKIITMFELQGDDNVRKTWEIRKLYSADDLHLFSRALLEEAVQYHTMQSEKYNTQAAWLSCGLACCHLLNYVGDQATEIVLKYYFGDMGALIAGPYLKLLKSLAGELTSRYIEGEPLLPTSDDKEAAWNTLFEICNGIISNEATEWLKDPKDLKKLGGLVAIFMALNTAQHYWLDEQESNRGNFWLAVKSSCSDLFKESAKQTVGKLLGDALSQIGKDNMKKLSDWFGEKMNADEQLRELVISKLEDVVKNNPVQSIIPTLYDALTSDEHKDGKFDADLFYSILVPDKDDDNSLEDYGIAIKALLEVAIQPFVKVMKVAGIIDAEPKVYRKRREDEAYS